MPTAIVRRERGLVYLLLMPAVLLILAVLAYPFIAAVALSLTDYSFFRREGSRLVGFANFSAALFQDPQFWKATLHTWLFTVGNAGGSYLLGLIFALMLNARVPGRGLFRSLLLLPFVVPPVVIATCWKLLMDDQLGLINNVLLRLGVVSSPILWLADPRTALLSVTIVNIWRSYPFNMVALLAGLQTIPDELYDAARIDGAGPFHLLTRVVLPLLRHVSLVSTLLMAIWTFNTFDLVWLLTGGGPGDATEVLASLVYKRSFIAGDMGYASGLGLLMLGMLTLLGWWYIRAYYRD